MPHTHQTCSHHQVEVPKFFAGPVNYQQCPHKYEKITSLSECETARQFFANENKHIDLQKVKQVKDDSTPSGCSLRVNSGKLEMVYNIESGRGENSFAICKREAGEQCVRKGSHCMNEDFKNYKWVKVDGKAECSGTCGLRSLTSKCMPGEKCCFGRCTPAAQLQADGRCALTSVQTDALSAVSNLVKVTGTLIGGRRDAITTVDRYL